MLSPLAVAIQQGRHWLVPAEHRQRQAIGGTVRLLVPLAIFAVVVALSYWAFRRAEGRMAEDL